MSTASLAQSDLDGPAGDHAGTRPHVMNPVLRITRLHFADRFQMLWVPLIILGAVALFGVVIFVLLQALTPATTEQLTEGFRYNQAVLWSWPGFIVTIGVYAYARTMPYAIGMMGSTRRHYWAGTALWVVAESLFLAAVIGAFLLLEQATGHWFTGARMFDVYALGDGALGVALLLSFSIGLASLSVGTCLAAVYLRWGPYGVMSGIAGLLVIIVGALALVLATGVDLVTFFTTGTAAKIAGLLLLIAVVAHAVSWLVVRRMPVGR